MFDINYKVTIGGDVFQSGKKSALLHLKTHASLRIPANHCCVTLAAVGGTKAKADDTLKVELGYGKSLQVVFTGKVAAIHQGIDQIQVEGLSGFQAMAAAHVNRLFENQKAGDIVRSAAGSLKVKTGTIQGGVKLASYALDNGRSVWEHCHGLAQRAAFDLYADKDDNLVFQKYAPKKPHTLQYGKDILHYSFDPVPNPVEGVTVLGESPVGQGQGKAAVSWLAKKEVKGAAGKKKGHVLKITDPAVRDKTTAGAVAKNIFSCHQVKGRGEVLIIGNDAVTLGSAIQISKMPTGSQNGQFKVTSVAHQLDKRRGFTTQIEWEKR